MAQPLEARTYGRSSAVGEIRVSHGVTRRESDGYPGGGDAFKRLPLQLSLAALRGVCDQAARHATGTRSFERVKDAGRIEGIRPEVTLSFDRTTRGHLRTAVTSPP